MSDQEYLADLPEKMKALRQARKTRTPHPSTLQNAELVQQVRACIAPVVQSFVKEDRGLSIQSEDEQGFFIAYGLFHVCHLHISASVQVVSVFVQSEQGSIPAYSGAFDERRVSAAVKDALLAWYQTLL